MVAKFEKLIDEIGKMSVLELAELVKALEDKFGVAAAAAMPVAPVVGAVAAAVQEEKSEFKVTLKEGGPEKIKTIKALRKVTTLRLSEAKQAVENAPTVIAESASKEDAENMKKELETAGAKVELT